MGAKRLSSAEKVAILLTGFGHDVAAELMGHMSENEIRRIGGAMSSLGRVEESQVNEVMLEFYELLESKSSFIAGGEQFTRSVIEKALGGDRGSNLAEEVASGFIQMESLDRVDGKALAGILRNEHPQTIALVMAFCDPKKGGEFLKYLPEPLHVEVFTRLAYLESVDPEVVRELDEHLQKEISQMGSWKGRKLGGSDKVASILNTMDKNQSQHILENLDEREPDLGEEVRSLMFTFDDIVRIAPGSMQKVLKAVDSRLLLLALKSASNEVKAQFFTNMSERAAKTLQEDLESAPLTRLSDVEAAQSQVLVVIKDLEAKGELVIEGGDDEYV